MLTVGEINLPSGGFKNGSSSEALRVEAAGLVLGVLRKKGAGLRADLKPGRARDIFLVLTSGTLYRELTVGRGWSRRQATRWLTDLLAHELLAR